MIWNSKKILEEKEKQIKHLDENCEELKGKLDNLNQMYNQQRELSRDLKNKLDDKNKEVLQLVNENTKLIHNLDIMKSNVAILKQENSDFQMLIDRKNEEIEITKNKCCNLISQLKSFEKMDIKKYLELGIQNFSLNDMKTIMDQLQNELCHEQKLREQKLNEAHERQIYVEAAMIPLRKNQKLLWLVKSISDDKNIVNVMLDILNTIPVEIIANSSNINMQALMDAVRNGYQYNEGYLLQIQRLRLNSALKLIIGKLALVLKLILEKEGKMP